LIWDMESQSWSMLWRETELLLLIKKGFLNDFF
jgi:hypothetical protein